MAASISAVAITLLCSLAASLTRSTSIGAVRLTKLFSQIDQLVQPFLLVDENHWVTSEVVIADHREREVGCVERFEHPRR